MPLAPSPTKLFVNKPRAYAVLEQLGLDGMIALNPINVYYLTNTVPILTKFGRDFPAFATFAADPTQPSFFVAHIHEVQNSLTGDREYADVMPYSSPRDLHDTSDQPEPNLSNFPVGPYELTAREIHWRDALARHNAELSATPGLALVRALRASGLDRGRVAVDDMRIGYLLTQLGLTDLVCIPGANVFRKIRMVKSDTELAMMRVAGSNNAIATMNAITAVQPGMRYSEVEQLFRLECAKLGAEQVNFVAGIQLGGFPDDITVAGKPFMIDAVSHTGRYHGDFARTVCIGEPSRETLRRANANKAGRDAFIDLVRPGATFSQLKSAARQAQIKSGMPPEIIIVNAHTVGLEHDDNAGQIEGPFDLSYNAPDEVVLEPGMVLTVDLPYFEVGWGGGHHEDLLLVTSNGYEPLNTPGDPLVIV